MEQEFSNCPSADRTFLSSTFPNTHSLYVTLNDILQTFKHPRFCRHDPTHQVRHICKAHKANTQKPTLQKSLPCANAQPTHPSGRNSYRLHLNTSANNYAQHLSPPTTPRLTNIYQQYVENFRN